MPTIVLQPDSSIGKDSYVTSQYSSANYGNSSNIIVGIYNKYINRALVQISLPSELLGMIIDSAILSLTISSDNDYVQRPTICKITSAWVETTVNYSSCPAFTGGISGSKSGNTDLYDITSFVQDWANNEVNNGVILKAPSETALYTRIYYYSCEASTADYRPKLTITWHSPNTAPTTPMLTSQNDGGVLSSIQPIAWTESADAEGNAIQYEIVASEDDGSTIIPIASGVNEASINFDFSTLTPSQNWKIGIRATDGSLYSDYDWSDIPFTVMPQINPLVYNADFSTWILNGLMLSNGKLILSDIVLPTVGLLLNLDAQQLTGLSNNQTISQFTDYSGNNNHALQITATKQPKYTLNVINGKPSIYFDGVDKYMILTNECEIGTGTVIAVIKTSNAGSSYRGIYVKQNATGLFLLDNILTSYNWLESITTSYGNALNDNNMHIVGQQFGTGLVSNLFYDGNVGSAYTHSINNQNSKGVIGAGMDDGLQQNYMGYIGQLLIYDHILSTAEHEQLNAFLNSYWGVA